jgi:hypothetical protein
MQVHSIISKTIPEEVLHGGHLSIRFLTDGCSLLLEDQQYNPLIINRFSVETPLSLNHYIQQCTEWLDTHSLLEQFSGETTLVPGKSASIFIPDDLFSAAHERFILQQAHPVDADDSVRHRNIKKRPFHCIFSVPDALAEFSGRFGGETRIIHPSECMLSVADQVNASDHQRGCILIESQPGAMEILVIRDDTLVLSNRYRLKSEEDLVYHTLNTFKQLGYDRRAIPVFFAGTLNDEQNPLLTLKKYIRKVLPLPYIIPDIEKASIAEHVILAEATKCE